MKSPTWWWFDSSNKKGEVIHAAIAYNHCDNAPCIKVCPVQATFQREDGIMVDNERCVACAY